MSDYIPLTDEEKQAISDLAKLQELTTLQVVRQAIRLYQAVTLGDINVITESSIGCPIID